MLHRKDSSIATLALLLALAVVPKPATASEKNQVILAQTPNTTNTIPLPKNVKSGTKVRIDGSSSAATFNQALKQRFEKEYPGTQVNIGYRGTNAALNSLRKGQIDIAAIGRPLTDKERAQGLVAVPLPRTKIAVVVGPKNTFKGSITDAQFARIFRGEIRDWSAVGGKRGRIRMIDRPINSDTRQALRNYPVFRSRPFRSGANTVRLPQDSTSALLDRLGTNGIGYAISNQVVNRPNARIVLMHKVSTNDPRYPFSQPIFYVYRRNNPTPAALAFIGFASATGGQQAIKAVAGIPVAAPPKAIAPATSAKPAAPPPTAGTGTPGSAVPGNRENNAITTTPPVSETQERDNRGGFGWLWWLIPLLALLGIPIWWLLKNRRTSTTAVSGQTPPPPVAGGTTSAAPNQTIVPPTTNITETIAPTPIPETTPTTPTQIQETTAPPLWGEDSLPATNIQSETAIPSTNWLGGAAVIGGAALAGAAASQRNWHSTITLTPDTNQQSKAIATWQVSEAHKQAVREQGGKQLVIRLYDITDINQIQTEGWQIFQQFNVDEQANQMLLPILVGDRDYTAEIGYVTEDDRWLPLAKSNTINIPAFVAPAIEVLPTPLPLIPTTPADWGSSITLTPQSGQLALAAWQVSNRHKQALRQQGGTQLVLRLYDVTETSIDEQNIGNFPQFAVDEEATQMLVPIPQTNRDYASEIGYLTNDNRWLLLARSAPVRIVPSIPTTAEIITNIPTPTVTTTPTTSTINLTEFDSKKALAAWLVLDEHKQVLRQQGGRQLALRLYDVTEITRNATENWDIFQQFNVDEQASQMLVPILVSDRDYAAEIGYLTEDDRWLLLARSAPTRISSDTPPSTEIAIAAGVATALGSTHTNSSISLAPESNHQLIANWQVSFDHKQALQQQGGKYLILRLYDVTGIDLTQQESQIFQQFAVDEQAHEMLLELPVSDIPNTTIRDRDYLAEIGYLTEDERWLLLARSAPIQIVSSLPTREISPEIVPVIPTLDPTPVAWDSTITLTPENDRQAIANWQVSFDHKQALQQQGGKYLILRLYDVTGIDLIQQEPQIFQQFAVDEQAHEMLLELPVSDIPNTTIRDRDYLAEIGYLTEDERWLLLARSAPIQIVSSLPTREISPEIVPVIPTLDPTPVAWDSTITLTPENDRQAIANWQVSFDHKQALQQQGGKYLILRLYDVTGIDLTQQESQIFQQFAVDEQAHEMLLELPVSDIPNTTIRDRDYLAEIGYLTEDERWLLLARSAPIKISAATPPSTEINLAPGVAAALTTTLIPSSISLASATANQLIANWQASPEQKQALQQQGGRHLVLRLYDVTESDINSPEPRIFQQFAVDEQANDMLLEIPVTDSRIYATEIGYLTDDNRWLLLARSAPIQIVSSVPPVTETIEIIPTLGITTTDWDSTITLTSENSQQALANWQISYNHKQALRENGGKQLAVRLYDVTEIDLAQDNPQIFQQFPVDEQVNQILLPIPLINRDYVAEVGYLTNDENWLMAARSTPIKIVPDVLPARKIDLGALGAVGALGALGAVVDKANDVPAIIDDNDMPYGTLPDRIQSEIEAAKFNLGSEELTPEILAAVDEGLPDLPSGYDESRIVLMPRDPQWAYAYWDIPSRHKEELRQQGGSKLALRFYDVTDVNMDYQNPHSVQEFECDEMAREWYLPVPVSDRDYIVEIGYLTNDGRWLMLARSNSIRVPPLYPSSWSNDQFITVRWEEELEHKQFLDLGSPAQEATTMPSNGFHDSFFGMVPEANLAAQSVSSYIFPSGIGKWASGIGFASEAPERSRQFWLMADAELVVYGATEPDAVIMIGGRPIKANSDGTFRFQLSFQDGMLDFPIEAIAPDGEQSRSIHLKFNRETPLRNTNTKEEAEEE